MSEKWLLCLDPDTTQIYTINLLTSEVHIEKDAPKSYLEKAVKTVKDILGLLHLNDASWLCESKNSQRYRRRKIPSYLLHKICSDYPTYVCQSTLSLAFAEVNSIKLEINMTEYTEEFQKGLDDLKKEMLEKKKLPDNLNPEVLEKKTPPETISLEAGLVTGADEVIKNILRFIHKDYGIKLKPKDPNKKFILKIFGFREYLTGNFAMLSYDRIRINLRGLKNLPVILTEIKKFQEINELFPTIIEREPQEAKTNNFKPIQWKKYEDVPILLWYPPESLFNTDQLEAKDVSIDKQKAFFSLKEPEITRPRLVSKTVMKDFNEHRRNQHENNVIFLEHNVLYSGECDWPFRLRICGIENFFKIFEQADDADIKDNPEMCAVYNGLTPPGYVTKIIKNTEPVEHATKKEKKKEMTKKEKEEKKARSCTPKLIKTKDREANNHSNNVEKNNGIKKFSRFTSHGVSGTNYLNSLAKRYGLDFTPYMLQIEVKLYFGSNLLKSGGLGSSVKVDCVLKSKMIPFSHSPKWYEWLEFKDIKISQLPQELRACIDVIGISATGETQILAHISFEIFDCVGKFRSGLTGCNLWPFYCTEPRLSCMNEFWSLRGKKESDLPLNEQQKKQFLCENFARLYIQLESFVFPMYWSLRDEKLMQSLGFPTVNLIEEEEEEEKNIFLDIGKKIKMIKKVSQIKKPIEKLNWNEPPKTDDLARLQTLLNTDPLNRNFTDEEKFILLKCRHHYKTLPSALPIFLSAIDWCDPGQVGEAHQMLKVWSPLPPEEALPLLDAQFADEAVRLYAVERISTLSDDELALYMLELTQALMFESQHFSALGEFLLERSLANPYVVGHELFWQLRSQLHVKPSFERFSLILEQLLMLCGSYRNELFSEVNVNDGLMKIAESIKLIENKDKRLQQLKEKLNNFKDEYHIDDNFCLAVDSRMQCIECLDGCKVLNSKKLPLLLKLKNSQEKAPPIIIIYKTGDDLRQDILTIQLIKIMDKIWLDDGYDLRMKPYKVVACKDQVGMIEFVQNSETTEAIHSKYGGRFGALKENTIWEFLKANNESEPKNENKNENRNERNEKNDRNDNRNEKNDKVEENSSMDVARENFLRSCAGYCVATYVLGIGDRHSGNIMVTKTGHLFHIDFGHFLGNYKKKFGVNRERDPFVFTQEMAYVLGGKDAENFKTFEDYCTKAYNLVRKHGNFLISIFMMMLSAGMPELSNFSDIEYLKSRLSLNLSEQEATNKFKREIHDSLNTTSRKIDNLLHNMKRK